MCTIIAQIIDFVNEGGVYSERGKGYNKRNVPVAQWIEHQLPELGVVGSTPIGRTTGLRPFFLKQINQSEYIAKPNHYS